MLFGLILTLCYSGECYETIPETFYTIEDCTDALKQLDAQHPTANQLFRCEKLED